MPTKQYIKKLNGFYVKDEDARADLDSIHEELNSRLDTNPVKFIAPKFMNGIGSSDAHLIKYKNNNILIDCSLATAWDYIKDMLDNNDAAHIDYFILTHFHADHYGNLQNLIDNGYIDTQTVIYSAAETTTFGDDYNARKSAVLGIFSNEGLSYTVPQEGQIVNIDDLKLTFVNCDAQILDSYETKYANSCSTVVLFEYGATKALYTGDAGGAVYHRLLNVGFPGTAVDLFKIGHHGIDTYTNNEFVRKLAPKFAIQPSGPAEAVYNQYGLSEEVAILKNSGTLIYPSHMQSEYIVFESDGSTMACTSGEPYGTSDQIISYDYYVDAEAATNAIQDGTQEHPFSEIMQAISSIPFSSAVTSATIHVADGYYGKSHPTTNTEKNRITINTSPSVNITIQGNSEDRTAVVLNGVYIENSNVNLKDLTVDVDQWDGIFAYKSLLQINNVAIKSNTDTQSASKSGMLLRHGTKAIINGELRIENVVSCIIVQTGSELIAHNTVSIGAHTASVINAAQGTIIETGNYLTFDNNSDKYSFDGYHKTIKTPVQIMQSHTDYTDSVTLLSSAANYSWIEIFFHTKDNYYRSTGKIYSPNNKRSTVVVPSYSGNDGSYYDKKCCFKIEGTTISVLHQNEVHIVSGSAPTITAVTGKFNIDKVIAGYSDYIDLA